MERIRLVTACGCSKIVEVELGRTEHREVVAADPETEYNPDARAVHTAVACRVFKRKTFCNVDNLWEFWEVGVEPITRTVLEGAYQDMISRETETVLLGGHWDLNPHSRYWKQWKGE